MKSKKIGVIIAIVAIIGFLLSYIISYAASTETIYVNLTKTDLNGIGYGIGNPTNAGTGNYIWHLQTYNSNDVSDINTQQRNLYCIKANYGDTWNANNSDIVSYNLSYDLQEEREKLLTLLGNDVESHDILKQLLDPTNGYYRELLWILDNAYIEGQTDRDTFIRDVMKIQYDEEYDVYYYEDGDSYEEYHYLITDADIKAVQKAAIWYYTNHEDSNFDQLDKSDWLTITTDGNKYTQLSDLTRPGTSEGEDRNKQAERYYKYLVNEASKNADKYTAENNYKLSGSAEVNTSGLTQDEDGKYVISSKRVNSNDIIGPIVIDKNGDAPYTINIAVTNESGQPIDYTFVDSNGDSLGDVTIKDLVGRPEGFYISVPVNTVNEVNVQIDITEEVTEKKLWLTGTETADSITLNNEQPIVEINRTQKTTPVKLIGRPGEFDLALRKYITEINGVKLSDLSLVQRLPNISEDTLQTGTTATYRHKKDPVVIVEDDVITYSITIYNEGNKAGYASQIVDQLPTGLISSTENPAVVVSKDKNGSDKNSYNLTYNTVTNQIVFDIVNTTENPAKSLSAYKSGNGLDYETITIKCKVVEEADQKVQKILTNVAWINGAYDTDSGKVAVDRDSQPENYPDVNRGNMENYKGNTNNKDDLTDSNYYYQGEQDDDDFEKLVLMPIEKKFDLALFKHIAAISKDQNIEPGEYVTDTGNIDGTYLRAPVVKSIENGIVIYEEDSKAALTVEPGDYVLYTIRVYNEGEINGYASKIKDTLPIGLEFVAENEEYNGIWNLEGYDTDGRQVVTTTWYAKGQGDELNSVEGEPNYTANLLKALNPEAPISEENPDYLDAQILCKVVEDATSDRVLVNYAQISDDSDENGNPIDDIDSTPDEWVDGEDDQDIERIKLQCFDLSLRKFISQVNGVAQDRAPVVDVSPLVDGTDTTAIYNHSKKPVAVQVGDKVVYTLRVYNEGDIDGYASKITDYLPPHLTLAQDSEINSTYGWQVSEDGRIVTTNYLADKILTAFDGTTLDYEDIQIECVISDTAPIKTNLTNIAEISEYTYNGGTVPKDVDSTADNVKEDIPSDEELPGYKNDEIDKPYVPGNEDDDDFEKVYIKDFDLALRKFITQVKDRPVTDREPQVKIENGQITYEHTKEPLYVHVDDVIIYTLRIYNEGEISGYASEITDDIPEFLEYLPEDSTNVEYMWKMYDENDQETDNVEEAVKVKTNYLSKENGEDNLIKAFDGTTLDYKDIKIAFKVKDPNSNEYIITNHAQISDDTDENGNPVTDKDSEPDEWNEGEDDQDIENVKVEYFDLALLKYVTKVIVIEDGVEKITETGYDGTEVPEPVVKVELDRKKLDKITVKFGFGIKIINEGDIPGYATEITDYVPEGLKFVVEDNPEWTDEGNNVISTRQLEGTLLQPGESATVEVILTWINGEDNLNLKTNVAEISEDDNEYDVPDIDSTPDNKEEGEDDIDEAQVILNVSTGLVKTYFTLTLGLLATIGTGIILIKKFIL